MLLWQRLLPVQVCNQRLYALWLEVKVRWGSLLSVGRHISTALRCGSRHSLSRQNYSISSWLKSLFPRGERRALTTAGSRQRPRAAVINVVGGLRHGWTIRQADGAGLGSVSGRGAPLLHPRTIRGTRYNCVIADWKVPDWNATCCSQSHR